MREAACGGDAEVHSHPEVAAEEVVSGAMGGGHGGWRGSWGASGETGVGRTFLSLDLSSLASASES